MSDSVAPYVLLVENEPIAARAIARRIHRTLAVRVRIAHGADGALALLSEQREPLAVVLDGHLGGTVHGADVLRALREARCEAPSAFWTSQSRQQVQSHLERCNLPERPPVFGKLEAAALMAWLADSGG